jgi:hypothetical protein
MVSHPMQIRQLIRVEFPEAWTIEESKSKIRHPAFEFSSEVKAGGRSFEMHLEYRSLADAVLPAQLESYREAMEEVNDELYYTVQHWGGAAVVSEEKDWSGLAYLIIAILSGLLVGGLFAGSMYFWDPSPRLASTQEYVGLSGWLILPIIGVILIPLSFLIGVGSFVQGALEAQSGYGEEILRPWQKYFFVGAFLETFLAVASVMLWVLLFGCRTSFPIFYVVLGVFYLGSDAVLYAIEAQLPQIEAGAVEERVGLLVRGGVGLLLWGTYMIVSQRVKATFVKRRDGRAAAVPPPLPAA